MKRLIALFMVAVLGVIGISGVYYYYRSNAKKNNRNKLSSTAELIE
jgi:cbb3-type cytochrome oxidase subunit 3